MLRVALDAMGGDNAPKAPVLGALNAVKEQENVRVLLVGQEEAIRSELAGQAYPEDRIEIVNATEVIETGEPPVVAIQKKKDSSIVVGMKLVKEGKADCFVSAGSTGAILVGGQVLAGRLTGVKRSPLAVVIPTSRGRSVLIDCGANVDVKPEVLVQFAIMGSLYAEHILKIERPTVGLVNIGTEEEKGNELTRDTYPLLKDCGKINFIGNAEARDLANGVADVYVCEAFTGNVVLKMYEGVAKALMKEIKKAAYSSLRAKIGGALLKPALSDLRKTFDSSEDGGAPMLGLNGLVVKAHGNSTELQMKNAVLQCIAFYENHLDEMIREAFQK